VLIADADEFLVYEDCENKPLLHLLKEIEEHGANTIRTDMVDMYPYGDLSEADFTRESPFDVAVWFDNPPMKEWRLGSGWFSNNKSWTSSLRHRLVPESEPHAYVAQKYALFRYYPWVRLSQGLHYQAGMVEYKKSACFAHFKYHAAFSEKVRIEVGRKQHFNGASEYRGYVRMLAEGRPELRDSSVSAMYSGSSSFSFEKQ
jgi:hypothetical protein